MTASPLRVLFSRPLTFRSPEPAPPGFEQVMDESRRLWELGVEKRYKHSGLVLQLELLWRLVSRRAGYAAVVAGRYGDLFAIVQGLWPFGRRPFLLLDTEWPNRRPDGWKKRLSIFAHRLIGHGATRIQVFCKCEAEAYQDYFGIDRSRFIWIPYCTDDREHQFEVGEESYIFTGGLHHRDYATLRDAVRDLPIEVRIAAPAGSIPPANLSPNMKLLGRIGRDEYFQTMARAKLVVLSLEPHILRSPGVITYVYAMRLGKCVIVNEPEGAPSYIENGRTGVIVPHSSPAALRSAIVDMLNDDERRRTMGQAARDFSAQAFSIGRYLRDVEAAVVDMTTPVPAGVPNVASERAAQRKVRR